MTLSLRVPSAFRVKHTHHGTLDLEVDSVTLFLQVTSGRVLDIRWVGNVSVEDAARLDNRLLPALCLPIDQLETAAKLPEGWAATLIEGRIEAPANNTP